MPRTSQTENVQRVDSQSIMALPYDVGARLRYSHDPSLGLSQSSTRTDVLRVRDRLPQVRGIGPVALRIIDAWLREGA